MNSIKFEFEGSMQTLSIFFGFRVGYFVFQPQPQTQSLQLKKSVIQPQPKIEKKGCYLWMKNNKYLKFSK